MLAGQVADLDVVLRHGLQVQRLIGIAAVVADHGEGGEGADAVEQGPIDRHLARARLDREGRQDVRELFGIAGGRDGKAPVRTDVRQHVFDQVQPDGRPRRLLQDGEDRLAIFRSQKLADALGQLPEIDAPGHAHDGVRGQTMPQLRRLHRLVESFAKGRGQFLGARLHGEPNFHVVRIAERQDDGLERPPVRQEAAQQQSFRSAFLGLTLQLRIESAWIYPQDRQGRARRRLGPPAGR